MSGGIKLPKQPNQMLAVLRRWVSGLDKENKQLKVWLEANERARDVRDGHIQVLEDTLAAAGLPVPRRPDY